jgi:hypothetical protein
VKRKKELPFGSMLAFVVKVINLVNNTKQSESCEVADD